MIYDKKTVNVCVFNLFSSKLDIFSWVVNFNFSLSINYFVFRFFSFVIALLFTSWWNVSYCSNKKNYRIKMDDVSYSRLKSAARSILTTISHIARRFTLTWTRTRAARIDTSNTSRFGLYRILIVNILENNSGIKWGIEFHNRFVFFTLDLSFT